MMLNLYAAWMGFALGALSGAVTGLFFYKSDWLGGYASWQRRMIRLGHIAFFGLGGLNLAYALTVRIFEMDSGVTLTSMMLIGGLSTMSLVCYLSAWKPAFRHLFFIPAGLVTVGIILFVWRLLNT